MASISAFPARPAICDLHVRNFSQSGSTWPLAGLAASSWAARMLVSSCGQLLEEFVFFVFFLLFPQNHLCCVWSSFYIFPANFSPGLRAWPPEQQVGILLSACHMPGSSHTDQKPCPSPRGHCHSPDTGVLSCKSKREADAGFEPMLPPSPQ